MKSLRAKFGLIIVLILIFTLSISGFVVIQQNVSTLTTLVQRDALSFADFASIPIADHYDKKYVTGEFLDFQRQVFQSLQRNIDVSKIRIISKDSHVLYDSLSESEGKYDGPERIVINEHIKERLLDIKPSLKMEDDSIVYFRKDMQGRFIAVDFNDVPVDEDVLQKRFVTLVYPLPEKTYGVEYTMTYKNVDQTIYDSVTKLLIVIVGSCIAGIFIALFFVRQIVRPVEKLRAGAEKIAAGSLDVQVDVKTKDEIGLLANTFNSMARDLKKNTDALVEKEKLDHEVHLAAEIQRDLIPKTIPVVKGLDIAASIFPATEIGGDYYDFIPKGDNMMVFIGDVTGHGVPAGLVEAITSSLVYTFSQIHDSTDSIIADMNRVMFKKTRPNVFVTAIMGFWDTAKQCFQYTNAGHDQIVHYNARTGKASLLEKGGLALGMIPDISNNIQSQEICLSQGDLLVMYTDGIPEAWNANKEQFGIKRFMAVVEKHAQLASARNIHDALIQDVHLFMAQTPQADDITMMVLKKI